METQTPSTRNTRGSRAVKILFAAGLLSVCLITFGVFALGAREPLEHQVQAERVIPAPLDSVWARLVDFGAYPAWRPELGMVKVGGQPGDSLTYMEVIGGREGMMFLVEEMQPPHRLVVRNISDKLPLAQLWDYELVRDPGGCRVRITETGTVNSVSLRFYFRYVNSHNESIERRLDLLEKSYNRDPS